jgi:uncharacterized protein (TIGR02466 family)
VAGLKAFTTQIYRSRLASQPAQLKALNRQLLKEIADIMGLDLAGRAWSKENYKNGFTSYASANELQKSSSTFSRLEQLIDSHVRGFCRSLEFDLGGRPLRMTTCWVNVMEANTHHGMHLHPLSVISGTYYVQVPVGASAIKFEDPRLGLFMGAPPKKRGCRQENRQFVGVAAEAGSLVLFESWLRHEVPLHKARRPRVSISFNYGWGD